MASAEPLAALPLLADLSPPALQRLAARARRLTLSRSSVVIRQGERDGRTFLILSGTLVAKAADADGVVDTLSTMAVGELFGEIAALDGQPRTATVIAMTDAELLCIERADFLELLRSGARFRMQVMALMASRLRRQSAHLASR